MLKISERELVTSLASNKCPACGRHKRERQTFCGADYFRLPKEMQRSLYNGLDAGYAEAVSAAMHRLGANTFQLDTTSPKPGQSQLNLFNRQRRLGMGR